MIRISTKGRYGTRLMLNLAIHYNENPMLLKDIAKQEDISEGYLQHIVDALKGAGLIRSNRIGHGGYTLTRHPSKINLKEILTVLEGSICLVECIDNPDVCDRSKTCIARKTWKRISDEFSKSLESINLEDMIKDRIDEKLNIK